MSLSWIGYHILHNFRLYPYQSCLLNTFLKCSSLAPVMGSSSTTSYVTKLLSLSLSLPRQISQVTCASVKSSKQAQIYTYYAWKLEHSLSKFTNYYLCLVNVLDNLAVIFPSSLNDKRCKCYRLGSIDTLKYNMARNLVICPCLHVGVIT